MKNTIKQLSKLKIVITVLVLLLLGFAIGRFSNSAEAEVEQHEMTTEDGKDEVVYWTCSMHPEIHQDHPGKCPICGMDLIPEADTKESDLPFEAVKMSETAMKLADVQTLTVEFGTGNNDISLIGKVAPDPQYAYAQTTHISGRVEDLFINNIGEYVKLGQQIAVIYSPELVNAQRELLQAYKRREINPKLYEAVRKKFKFWKIGDSQVEAILAKGSPIDYFPIYADHSGYLIEKNIEKGEHVEDGTDLFTISQLNNLWGVFNVFEKDAAFVRKGLPITYSAPSFPGKEFETHIDFVEPILDAETRTLRARILIPNPDLTFKPEMFLNGVLHSTEARTEKKLLIPKSSVLWTGKKSVVYVKVSNSNEVAFEMRKVNLGARIGENYVVESGLEHGEEIVVQGAFTVDAAAQLANKPSMMNKTMEEGHNSPSHHNAHDNHVEHENQHSGH